MAAEVIRTAPLRRRPRAEAGPAGSEPTGDTAALRMARSMGLLDGPKAKHVNAKVPPRLFQAAADKVGTTSPAMVISAALASLATEDELGRWLVSRWGVLADVDPTLLDQVDL